MASASLSSAVPVAVLAAVSVASASDPLEQSRSLRADPCVRLLNNTASIGCATGRRGAVALETGGGGTHAEEAPARRAVSGEHPEAAAAHDGEGGGGSSGAAPPAPGWGARGMRRKPERYRS